SVRPVAAVSRSEGDDQPAHPPAHQRARRPLRLRGGALRERRWLLGGGSDRGVCQSSVASPQVVSPVVSPVVSAVASAVASPVVSPIASRDPRLTHELRLAPD